METFLNLFNNTIVFFAMISLIFIWPIEIDRFKWPYKIIMGFVLSIMAVFTMLNSVDVGNGLYIDARYAIPIITIIFFGTFPGIMVIITIILVRLFILGGAGAPIGITYAVIQGLVTFAFKKLHYDKRSETTTSVSIKLLILAVILQTYLILSAFLFLPFDIASEAVSNNWLYLITIYPILVFIFSMIVGFRTDYYTNMEQSRTKDYFFKLTLERSPTPMAIFDEKGNCLHINEAWIEKSGYGRDEFQTMGDWVKLVSKAQDKHPLLQYKSIREIIEKVPTSEYEIVTKHNGNRVWRFDRKEAGTLPDGTNIFVSVAIDVTERKQYEQELIDISYHDFLTGLKNRRYYDDHFRNTVFESNNVTVIYGDMNNLKSLNDYYGHNRGDDAIIVTSNILKEVFHETDNIFRFGGDEFLIVTQDLHPDYIIEKMDEASKKVKETNFGDVAIGITLGMYQLDQETTLDAAIMKAESRMYEYKILESTSARSGTIDVILTMLFEKDPETERHSKRVQEILKRFSDDLNLNTNEVNLLLRAGLLHDIGKILTPTSILLEKNRLSEDQYDIIKKHPLLGYQILSSRGHLKQIGEIVLSHHEHIDGSGYPNGLKGNDIPYFSRILSIVDAFEAITSDRPYRLRKSFEEAKDELLRYAGTQFDKELVEQFIKVIPELPQFEPLTNPI